MATEKRVMNCIMCPMGCELTVTLDGGKFVSVTGNTCPRGAKYAQDEVTAPKRMLTSTVRIKGGFLTFAPRGQQDRDAQRQSPGSSPGFAQCGSSRRLLKPGT
jgi:CxxC motif-containing protein